MNCPVDLTRAARVGRSVLAAAAAVAAVDVVIVGAAAATAAASARDGPSPCFHGLPLRLVIWPFLGSPQHPAAYPPPTHRRLPASPLRQFSRRLEQARRRIKHAPRAGFNKAGTRSRFQRRPMIGHFRCVVTCFGGLLWVPALQNLLWVPA